MSEVTAGARKTGAFPAQVRRTTPPKGYPFSRGLELRSFGVRCEAHEKPKHLLPRGVVEGRTRKQRDEHPPREAWVPQSTIAITSPALEAPTHAMAICIHDAA